MIRFYDPDYCREDYSGIEDRLADEGFKTSKQHMSYYSNCYSHIKHTNIIHGFDTWEEGAALKKDLNNRGGDRWVWDVSLKHEEIKRLNDYQDQYFLLGFFANGVNIKNAPDRTKYLFFDIHFQYKNNTTYMGSHLMHLLEPDLYYSITYQPNLYCLCFNPYTYK